MWLRMSLAWSFLVVATPAPGAPGTTGGLAEVSTVPSGIEWTPALAGTGLTLTVSGPEDFHLRRDLATGESFTFGVTEEDGVVRADGVYVYELRLAIELDEETRRAVEPFRGTAQLGKILADRGLDHARAAESGSFAIVDGAIVHGGPDARPEDVNRWVDKATVLTISDGTISNSLCVGANCTSSPPFGDSTILLQEVNTRIKFDDGSSSSYPDRDWELTANDSAAGGVERFSITDCGTGSAASCADDEVFSIEAGVRENALYIESDGEIGVGTANPVADFHIITGDTPRLRLEQDASQGFAAQSWEVLGNEAGFIVRDVNAGSFVYPFRIEPGAGTHALVIEAGGRVGLGTLNPTKPLTIQRSTEKPQIFLANAAAGGATWQLGHRDTNENFAITRIGSGSTELEISTSGDVSLAGEIFTSGSCAMGCDVVFDADYDLPSIEEHAAEMFAKRHLPAIGPTSETGPFNLSKMTGGILNELEKAHIYIAQLSDGNRALEIEQESLKAEVAELRALVEALAEGRE